MAGVLIVEDNSTIRMMVTTGIKGLGLNTPIIEARTIAHARIQLQSHKPDVIILDLRLPGEPGQNLIRHVREELGQTDTPIIVASAWHDAKDRVLQMGATIFMPKPLDIVELLRTVQRYSTSPLQC
jgi:twitching motility two-component system response regulator PilH